MLVLNFSIFRAKQEEQMSAKKVMFVSNVRIHDRISDSVGKTAEISPGTKQSEDKKVVVNGISMVEQEVLPPASENGDSAMSSLRSYPPNHRYHNCTESDNEDELECEEEIDVDDYDEEKNATESADDVYDASNMEEDSPITYQKQTPGSFSSMESRTKCSTPFLAMKNLDSLLVEKLTQLKSVNPKNEQEQAVDASLSSWLVSSQKTPARKAAAAQSSASSHGSNTVRNFSDRPILGVLTMEHLKQIEASESPRKSPNHSTEDRPIIGSVGSHWSEETPSVQSAPESTFKGIPNTTSKYREVYMRNGVLRELTFFSSSFLLC